MILFPRGIRTNNPANLKKTNIQWKGENTEPDDIFESFDTPVNGLRASMRCVVTWYRKYGLNTIRTIINRHAPPCENDTGSYQEYVCKFMNVDIDDPLMIYEIRILTKLMKAIVLFENGQPPKNMPEYWYEDYIYEQAAKLALEI